MIRLKLLAFLTIFFIVGGVSVVARADVSSSNSIVTLHVASSTSSNNPPTIILNGSNPIILTLGDVFIDPGAMASDTEGDDLSGTVVVTGGVGNGPTVNTNVVGTTTLVYMVTDPNNFFSTSTTRTVIVNPVPINTNTTPPVIISNSSSGGSISLSLSNFNVSIGTSSLTINWTTNISVVSTMSWGVNSDATNGLLSEDIPHFTHSISLGNLIPGTMYYVVVSMNAVYGSVGTFLYSFVTTPIAGSISPSNVIDANAVSNFAGNAVVVNWNNPAQINGIPLVTAIRVTRGTRFFPRDPNEGYIVYEGNANTFSDTNIDPHTTYYYVIFTKDSDGNYSSGTAVKYIPTPAEPVLQEGTSSSLFGGEISTTTSSIFDSIIFMQDNARIASVDGEVAIKDGLPVTIDIPSNLVSKDTEEISINFSKDTFLFKKLTNGWFESVIPSNFSYSSTTPFKIHFLSIGSETITPGMFMVSGVHFDLNSINIWSDILYILPAILLLFMIIIFMYVYKKVMHTDKPF